MAYDECKLTGVLRKDCHSSNNEITNTVYVLTKSSYCKHFLSSKVDNPIMTYL